MDTSSWGTRTERLVVVGGGQAAVQLIEVARHKGFEGRITLVSEEPLLPYQRPPLSKQYLMGTCGPDWLLYRPERFYERYAVDLRLGRRVVAIDRRAGRVTLADGGLLGYEKLALATGARSRRLAVPGSEGGRVWHIRTRADVDGLRSQLRSARKVVIIGGGFIGLETAAVLSQTGVEITLLVAGSQLIPRVVGADMMEFLMDQHRQHGVRIELHAVVTALEQGREGGFAVCLGDGRRFEADLVLAGIGALPNVELAQEAGLDCDDGIVVDELARTSDPAIVAAGDCTNHPNGLIRRRLRLETVHNAVEQGRTAGATIAGIELPYVQTPWVWSDQYQLRLQSVGIADGYDQTVWRGDAGAGRFSLFYFRAGELLAVNCINQPLVFGAVRRLLNERIALAPAEAADAGFDLSRRLPSKARLDFDVPWPARSARRQAAIAWGFE